MIRRFFKYLFVTLMVLGLLAMAAAGGGLYYLIVIDPGPKIEQSYIQSVLGRESPVYYRDGEEKIGVLFQGTHRQYLTYEQIPKNFINALVAAEDDQFFHHFGVDIPGIVRAMIVNIKAGRVVQGGSTLTQQTAKNLFKRESRSFKAKLRELLYAFRLEYHYPKEKILEFYINQFFVSGNGHGLGVAARYYFDKQPDELTLLECAFIAGSVKRPNYYNPFTKKTEAAAERARKRAEARAAYVLGKMRKLGMISELQYGQAMAADIVFNRGKLSYALNTVMDLVKDGLADPAITAALEENGISNVSTSGIRIITSVERDLQEKTLYALRRHLSVLDVQLRGYEREQVQKEYARIDFAGELEPRAGSFLFGTIVSVQTGDGDGVRIQVDLGSKKPRGTIDRKGLSRVLTAYVRYNGQRWSEVQDGDLALLLDQLHEGDRVFVSVRNIDEGEGTLALDLEKYPRLQGAALVLQDGAIRAMAGGMENRYFNRAVKARRLMGSTFKPFLFSAALQLGWNATDLLDNRRSVFVFMDRPYFPRPDHHSPYDFVSMSWAGVTSENVAAVWLLYHLLDHLTEPQIREVAAKLDMAPRIGSSGKESYSRFKQRIRDQFGIRINRDVLAQAAYELTVRSLEADFLFENREEEYRKLLDLPYGLNYDRYSEEIERQLENPELRNRERAELKLRRKILAHSFVSLSAVLPAFDRYKSYISDQLRRQDDFDLFSIFSGPEPLIPPEGRIYSDGQGRFIFSLTDESKPRWQLVEARELVQRLGSMDAEERARFWEEIQLEGRVTARALRQVAVQAERELAFLVTRKPYSMDVLAKIRDYRVMLGLQYLRSLGRAVGLTSRLEPVLSFPLGSNVITLLEAVRMYETMVQGDLFEPVRPLVEESEEDADEISLEGLAIIERIETADGRVIYRQEMTRGRVYDNRVSAAVDHIMQNTVTYGTGRQARNTVRLHSRDPQQEEELKALDIPVPMLGKTGTSNQFRNAAFLGFVPVLAEDGQSVMQFDGGYTVGVYVGYDENMPMVRGTTHVTGSFGALPIWSRMASSILDLERVGDLVDPVDLTFNGLGLRYPATGQLFVPVDPDKGGAVIPGRGARDGLIPPSSPVILTYGRIMGRGHFEPDRFFRPFWKNGVQSR
ncbi:transglycosylase domain-containing protein [Desulfolithobacter sp.]